MRDVMTSLSADPLDPPPRIFFEKYVFFVYKVAYLFYNKRRLAKYTLILGPQTSFARKAGLVERR